MTATGADPPGSEPPPRSTRRGILARLGLGGLGALVAAAVPRAIHPAGETPPVDQIRPKVLTVTMFQDLTRLGEPDSGEAHRWVTREHLDRQVAIAGAYSPLYLSATDEHGLIVTGDGAPNATASMMAVGLNPALDLRTTYVMVAGIAGTPPDVGTLGSAAWAEWVVNAGAANEIDPRELPSEWLYPYFHLGCATPWCTTGYETGTEVFHLNPALREAAYRLSAGVELADSDAARAFRARFAGPIARAAPRVIRADSLSSETFFGGHILSDWLAWWTAQWTDGHGTYGMANNEDHGTMTALRRLADAGRVDWNRIMVLRTTSDFDQPAPGRTALDAITDSSAQGVPIALGESLENAYRAGSVVAREIITNWPAWEAGVPRSSIKPALKSPTRAHSLLTTI
jgi:purine nucleoside permease